MWVLYARWLVYSAGSVGNVKKKKIKVSSCNSKKKMKIKGPTGSFGLYTVIIRTY
jgi:hypothetical protein